MGTKKGQKRKTARRAYEGKGPRSDEQYNWSKPKKYGNVWSSPVRTNVRKNLPIWVTMPAKMTTEFGMNSIRRVFNIRRKS